MNMVRIVNLRNYRASADEVLYKVDRTSAIGNPFWMKDESKRDEVCDKYKVYFDEKIGNNDARFMKVLTEIKELSKHNHVALGCWCAPKRCHAETILAYLKTMK